MTKKSTSKSSSVAQNPIVQILSAVAVIIAALYMLITGQGGTPSATPTPSAAAPVTAIPTTVLTPSANVTPIAFEQGIGAQKGFWQVYFTQPTGSRDRSTYVNGIDTAVAAAIAQAQRSIDIAAFEFNNPVITQAVLDAIERGVVVRFVGDNEHAIDDDDSTVTDLELAGVEIVSDERSAFMHNKFMIIDGLTVITGSTNFTVNDVYRNNNNLAIFRSRRMAEVYQVEFNEMFVDRSFGIRSPKGGGLFTQDGVSIEVLFGPEDPILDTIRREVQAARSSVRFMAFSFTLTDIGDTLVEEAQRGITIEGVFETVGSQTQFSRLTQLFCAGLDVRQDGNPFIMHHKVFIIDDETVIAGSLNFSNNAATSNDENIFIIKDRDFAAQYVAEFRRVQDQSRRPTSLTCE